MPYNRGSQRAASNRVRRFEAAYRLVFVKPALAREYMNMIMVRKDYSVSSSKPNLCMPGLGQGHEKKRHLHAQRLVSFIYNPEAKRRGHLLDWKSADSILPACTLIVPYSKACQ